MTQIEIYTHKTQKTIFFKNKRKAYFWSEKLSKL